MDLLNSCKTQTQTNHSMPLEIAREKKRREKQILHSYCLKQKRFPSFSCLLTSGDRCVETHNIRRSRHLLAKDSGLFGGIENLMDSMRFNHIQSVHSYILCMIGLDDSSLLSEFRPGQRPSFFNMFYIVLACCMLLLSPVPAGSSSSLIAKSQRFKRSYKLNCLKKRGPEIRQLSNKSRFKSAQGRARCKCRCLPSSLSKGLFAL